MSHRCPWCLEPLGLAQRREAVCPYCERPLSGPGGEPSELDLRYDRIEARQRARLREVLQWGVPAVTIGALSLSLLHLAGAMLAPLVAFVHILVLRAYLVREALRYLGPTRRLLTRWVSRFALIWLGLPGYAAMAVPVAGVIAGIATFVVLTEIVHVYTGWSLARERARQPVLAWETALLVTLAAITAMVVIAVVIGVAILGWSAVALVDWLQPD